VSVKPSQSASRVLGVLEKVAEHQSIGITELTRQLGEDKSAVQRALVTLARDGWIRSLPGKPTRWEVSERIHVVSQVAARGSRDLRERARPALQALRDATGETVLLNVPECGRFVVSDVLEGQHYLRIVLAVGVIVPARGSSTAGAILPYMSRERQIEFLGDAPDVALLKQFAANVERGYAISRGGIVPESTNLAAPIFEADGRPAGAVIVSAPSDRLTPEHFPRIGAMVSATARELSRGPAPRVAHGSPAGRSRRKAPSPGPD
jgi:IclR family acetate operon transcriptional repressor